MKLFNKLSSRAARERERESSLRTSSSLFKKSFTLIELSIVLLILSLLVGSLLVGRQIVDRAKIQRIIFEFDYYEKAFHQFYDTYRVVPGNAGLKIKSKYAEFNKFKDQCFLQESNNNTKLNIGYKNVCVYTGLTHMQLSASGLTEKNYRYYEYVGGKVVEKTWDQSCGCGWYGYKFNQIGAQHHSLRIQTIGGGTVSFSNELHKFISGFRKDMDFQSIFYSSDRRFSVNEWGDNVFKNALDNKNAIIIEANEAVHTTSSSTRYAKSGALSSKLTSELDAKIDDGRPGTGKFLAMKYYGLYNNQMDVCYDKNANEISTSIYHGSNNLKYGCNLLYVMEDVK